ncbi:MAG: DUF1800 domain-containing protein [Bordetella sp.]|uniref:DUF1800 domain-containing protein n=1 Tax=Bordetella sp. TaxID=28081 RepID=UPI003F7BD350
MKTGLHATRRLTSAPVSLLALFFLGAASSAARAAPGPDPTAHGAPLAAIETPGGKVLDVADARFLLDRTGFAPDPRETAQYVGLTRAQAVDRLLATTRKVAVTPLPAWFDEPIPTPRERKAWTPDEKKAAQMTRNRRYREARVWWVTEMLHTPSPLTERMTLFWHNHFVSGQDKVPWPQTMLAQNLLLRRDALGNFGAMLHDVAKDPAMLQYLDGASNRKGHPNENFAREVMELFTLGEGHYTQKDVTEAARAYTGWGLNGQAQFVWRPRMHDNGDKTVFGKTGNFDGDQMLDLLLARPETARLVTAKLWREFISDTPDPRQVAAMADAFRSHNYDIRTVLHALFLSKAFWQQEHKGSLTRSPVDFVIGTVRAFDIGYGSPLPLVAALNQLGQNLYAPPDVKGWRGGQTWINSATLLARDRFIEAILRSAGEGTASRMPRPMSAAETPDAMMPAAFKPDARPRMSDKGPHFDPARWLVQEHASGVAIPDAATRTRIEQAVLATRPAEPISPDVDGLDLLQALLADPAYQLK